MVDMRRTIKARLTEVYVWTRDTSVNDTVQLTACA